MRIFLAVVPPPDALAALDRHLPDLVAAAPELRFPAPEKWHLTLVFLGKTSPRQVERLRPGMAAAAAVEPFELVVAGGGSFPDRADRARVLWAGVEGDLDRLGALAKGACAAARAAGVEVERRPYRAHLTLARARRGAADAKAAVALLAELRGTPWTVDEVHLVQSTLGPQARYDVVETWRLGIG